MVLYTADRKRFSIQLRYDAPNIRMKPFNPIFLDPRSTVFGREDDVKVERVECRHFGSAVSESVIPSGSKKQAGPSSGGDASLTTGYFLESLRDMQWRSMRQ